MIMLEIPLALVLIFSKLPPRRVLWFIKIISTVPYHKIILVEYPISLTLRLLLFMPGTVSELNTVSGLDSSV